MKRTSILFCCLFAIAANFIAPTAKAQVNTGDSLALVDFYNSTNGPHWYNHTNWLTTMPVSTWRGIGVANSRVVKINLDFNNVNGIIPASFSNLTNLDTLILPYSNLNGAIPSSIYTLTNLSFLNLSNAHLTGTISPEIGNLTKLSSTLALSGNQLTGTIPAEIGNLTSLSNLSLSENQLTGTIPVELSNLTNLTGLGLNNNGLTGTIPAFIGNFTSLINLNLSENQLSGTIPAALGNLTGLYYFYLDNNQLSGTIPAALGNLTKLNELGLSSNQLSGAVPASFHKLTNLTYLNISYNQLSSFGYTSIALSTKAQISGGVNNNLFTFDELQFIAKNYHNIVYAPQDTILPIHKSGGTLSVYAGGTVSDNTYTWYKMGSTNGTTIKGAFSFTPSSSGQYYVYVTNSKAKRLTLYSDTVSYTMPAAQTQNSIANVADVKAGSIHFSIYPNPASNLLHIQTTGTAIIVLINSDGKVLLTKTINNTADINVSKYANGTYYIQNKTTGETQKVVVVH